MMHCSQPNCAQYATIPTINTVQKHYTSVPYITRFKTPLWDEWE